MDRKYIALAMCWLLGVLVAPLFLMTDAGTTVLAIYGVVLVVWSIGKMFGEGLEELDDKRKAKKWKDEGEDTLDRPAWADQPEYDKSYYMDKVNGLHIILRVIKWEIYLDQNGDIGQLIETLPTQSYNYERARQWCREYSTEGK